MLWDSVADQVVCSECARNLAPELGALLELAITAERVTRVGRFSVFPPLTALFDLACAAEAFADRAKTDSGPSTRG
jgi:hypothetical protein